MRAGDDDATWLIDDNLMDIRRRLIAGEVQRFEIGTRLAS